MSGGKALLAALEAKSGASLQAEMRSAPWASIDLSGEHHRLTLRIADPRAAARLLDGLDAHEFAIPGWLVASIFAESEGLKTIIVEALLIADAPSRRLRRAGRERAIRGQARLETRSSSSSTRSSSLRARSDNASVGAPCDA